MKPFLLPLLVITFGLAGCVSDSGGSRPATHAYTPAKGSPERNEILAAVHKAMAPKKVVLTVPYLKVHNGWAWIQVDPSSPDGKNHYESQSGLFRKKAQWQLVEWMPAEEGLDQKTYFQNLQKKYPAAPADIFPK